MRRRSFIAALFGAPVAAPSVLPQMIMPAPATAMAGLSAMGMDHIGASALASPPADTLDSKLAFFLKHRMPDWKIEQIRRDAYVTRLDPDLAANRSFSLSTKIRLQRDRYIAAQVEAIMDDGSIWKKAKEFHTKFGF